MSSFTPACTFNVNATYEIYQHPLSDLQRHQEAAFVSAGCASHSFGPPGSVTPCSGLTPSILSRESRAFGGGVDESYPRHPAELYFAAADYYTRLSLVGPEHESARRMATLASGAPSPPTRPPSLSRPRVHTPTPHSNTRPNPLQGVRPGGIQACKPLPYVYAHDPLC